MYICICMYVCMYVCMYINECEGRVYLGIKCSMLVAELSIHKN